jgi:hypothetical protein
MQYRASLDCHSSADCFQQLCEWGAKFVIRVSKQIACATAGIILSIALSVTTFAQTAEYTLVSGQALVVRLVTARVNVASLELEELKFEEPLTANKWRALGCRMRLTNHPYLQQALQRGFVLRIQTDRGGCVRSYEMGRDEHLVVQTTTARPVRTPTLAVTATGVLAPHPPFTPINLRIRQTLVLAATGALTPRAPFTPVSLRIPQTLTLTGTGSL